MRPPAGARARFAVRPVLGFICASIRNIPVRRHRSGTGWRRLAAATPMATPAVPSDFDFDMDVDPSSKPPNAGSLGIGHFSAPRNGSGRQASLSVQRRSSAAVSAVAIAAAASRRKSGYSSVVKNDRRSSILGRVSFNDSPGPNFAVDIFREQRQMRAEAVLHPCWKERRQRSDVRSATAPKAQICVIQSYSGSDIICILIAERGRLLGSTHVILARCSGTRHNLLRQCARHGVSLMICLS
ncbi:hypothetical protein BX661DRAFT_85352 [Kickxella alabastrina]|uniref:uncharacterized protein n=1 Tax=Kickxella alabastrina TaxID=61397 RepID=UPI00221FC41E|nr:uncharacterized protein BX661DRAFT_85352 [Kickxella alabastrina]KAI7831886.1 hypothetical protein BX661DRAFT_85352 [Kickxella alabastrina]